MQTKPHGKGLAGFIFGLLLATLIIGVVLYFLNNTPSGLKQPEAPKTDIQPEILTPRQQPQPEAVGGSEASGSGRYALPPGDITDKPPVAASVPAQASAPDIQPEQPKPQQQAKPREPQRKPEQPEAKPTPQQILESGSVERAREQARRERREAEAKAAEAKAAEQRGSERSGGRYVVQMGSFNNPEAADSQRAKLAMIGVDARVSSSQRNGQTVYRIQSGRLSRAQADALSERLRSNGIDSLTRQAD